MSTTLLIGLAFCCSAVPALLWVWNMLIYREPDAGSCAEMGHCVLPDAVSVLIPARNEEAGHRHGDSQLARVARSRYRDSRA